MTQFALGALVSRLPLTRATWSQPLHSAILSARHLDGLERIAEFVTQP